MPVKRHETSSKQLRNGLTGRKRRQPVAVAVLKNHDSLQRRAVRGRKHSLAMPGRTIHADATKLVILSGVSVPRSGALMESKDPAFARRSNWLGKEFSMLLPAPERNWHTD